MQQSDPYLSFRGIGKTFPGVNALTDISFDCYAGQVHALMGENGAGKSTLLKILSGNYAPDEVTATVTITPAPLRVAYGRVSVAYDGLPHTVPLQVTGLISRDVLYLTDAAEASLRITPGRPGFEEKAAVARDLMRRYRNALRELAK